AGQLRHDGGERRPDDRLVEGAEEEPEHDREEDLHLRAVAQAEGGVVRDRRRAALVGSRHAFHGFWSSLLRIEVVAGRRWLPGRESWASLYRARSRWVDGSCRFRAGG